MHPTTSSPLSCTWTLRMDPCLGTLTVVGVGEHAHVEMWCPPAMFLLSQVLLAWSGGPSSSSMVWQVLEVRLHIFWAQATAQPSSRVGPALEGSQMCVQEVHKP